MIITVNDILKCGYCVSGQREWFARHGLDFRHFVRNGIEADTLLRTGDHLASDVVTRTRARRQRDGGNG